NFVLEGDPLEQVTVRHLRATATGANAVRAVEVGFVRAEFSLSNFIFHGTSRALTNLEVRDLIAVIDFAKAPSRPPPPPNEKASLPGPFPERAELRNLNLTIVGEPDPITVQNFNLDLFPDHEGKLQVDQVDIPGVRRWANVQAVTSYSNRNLCL